MLLYYLIQVILNSFCFVLIHIPVYNIFIILHHSWKCDIWEFLYYLIQGILISFFFVIMNISVHHIFTFLHHIWGCDIWGDIFTFLCGLDKLCLHFLLLSACSWKTIYFIKLGNVISFSNVINLFLFEDTVLSCSYSFDDNSSLF